VKDDLFNTQPILRTMKTTLKTSALAAVSFLAVMNNLQAENSIPSDASRAASAGATHVSPCPSALKARVFGNGRWVALTSDGKLQCSTDGIEWNSACHSVDSFLRGVAFGNGQFVAVGGSYVGGGSIILTSVNGRSWKLQTCPSKQVLHGVAHSGDRFIAVGASGTILTSKTGQRWQKQASDTDATLAAVVHGNGTCVIGGDDGLILSSRDTLLWTRETSGTSRYVSNMTFDRERFVATTGDRQLASSDGSRWQAIDSAAVPAGGLLVRTNVTAPKVSTAK
jgi:photosystem II stability/assembly factor-like uncharacterized protein